MIPGRIESARGVGLAGALAVAVGTVLLAAAPGPIRNPGLPAAARQDSSQAPPPPRGPVSVSAAFRGESDANAEGALRALGLAEEGAEGEWRPWAEPNARPVGAKSESEAVPVAAYRTAGSLVVLLGNNSQSKIEARVRAQLPEGIYSIERIDLGVPSSRTVSIKRLQGALLSEAGAATKPAWLEPGQTVAVRFTNRLALLSADLKAVNMAVAQVAASRPDQARRLKVPLQEAQAHIAALLTGAYRKSRDQALRHTHRAILTVAHAQVLCNNSRGLGRIAAQDAEKMESALADLEESLTQISASCLGLTPDMEVEEGEGGLRIRLALANGGAESVPRVKIWVTAPEGASISPADKTAMGTLGPGQSVRAEFLVNAESPQPSLIVGHISYYYARSPGHLRLRTAP